MEHSTLQAYLEAHLPNFKYQDRKTMDAELASDKALVESIEARDAAGMRKLGERSVMRVVNAYFDEQGFAKVPCAYTEKFVGHGKKYGVNLTFIARDNPFASRLNHRFRLSILDFNAYSRIKQFDLQQTAG